MISATLVAQSEQDINSSDFKSAAWRSQQTAWELVDDLWNSPLFIREQGTKYLERFKKEKPEKYEERRSRSVPRNKFRESIETMAGMALKSDPAPDAPEPLKALFPDIDACGNSLHSFLLTAFERYLATGGGAFLVNASYNNTAKLKAEAGDTLTAADREGDRPFLAYIEPKAIINHRYEKIGGVDMLMQATIECVEIEPSGDFGEVQVKRHYILRPGEIKVQRYDEGTNKWVEEPDKGGPTGLDEIPLIPLSKFGTPPPLLDLAMLTVQFYNKESDFDNWCHYACVPRQITKLEDDSAAEKYKKINNANPDAGLIIFGEHAEVTYLEVTGHGLEIVTKRLETIDQRMAAIGVGMLAPIHIAPKTATEVLDTAGQRQSKLARYAREFENAVEKAFYIMGEYLQLINGSGAIDLSKTEDTELKLKMDFDRLTFDADQMAFFIDLLAGRNLSHETFFEMLGRVWDMPEGWTPAIEKQRLDSEAPTAPTIPPPDAKPTLKLPAPTA